MRRGETAEFTHRTPRPVCLGCSLGATRGRVEHRGDSQRQSPARPRRCASTLSASIRQARQPLSAPEIAGAEPGISYLSVEPRPQDSNRIDLALVVEKPALGPVTHGFDVVAVALPRSRRNRSGGIRATRAARATGLRPIPGRVEERPYCGAVRGLEATWISAIRLPGGQRAEPEGWSPGDPVADRLAVFHRPFAADVGQHRVVEAGTAATSAHGIDRWSSIAADRTSHVRRPQRACNAIGLVARDGK